MPSDSVKVAVRVRPFNQREKNAKSACVISMSGKSTTIKNPDTGDQKTFAFDHSYWSHDGFSTDSDGVLLADSGNDSAPYADQRCVFSDLGQGVLDNAWGGYNAALFAYGQTGSGKSYSMLGYGANKGIVPITCGELFSAIDKNKDDSKQFQVTFSMLEIYNEQVRDLLAPAKSQPKGGLRLRQNPQTGFYVEDLKRVPTTSYQQIERLMDQGTVNRTTASTNMNATSSRSHMVITLTFKQIYKNESGQSTTKSSRISLVDLAGSERASSSGATGDRLKEGSAINQSLSTLGKVISALADMATGKTHTVVPYRDSVLTKLLQSALGGNSKTIMIAALSPAGINYDETLSTLRYADRAKSIKTQATVNESPTDKLIRELKEEKNRLLEELQKLKVGGKDGKLEELEHQLEENRRQMVDMQLTWEQRMEAARQEWERSTSDLRWHTLPHIRNINEDPQLSGVVKIGFEKGVTTLGKPEGSVDDKFVEIRGFRIQKKHAVVENTSNKLTLTPGSEVAEVTVNGKRITENTRLSHLDRIKLGSNNLYLYIGFPSERNLDNNIEEYDYDYCQSELAEGAGVGRHMLWSISEDQGSGLDPGTVMAFQDYTNVLSKVQEANAMSEEMGKGVVFEAFIKHLAGHDDLGQPRQKEVRVKVTNKNTNKVWEWSREKFVDRKYLIEDLYGYWLDGENIDVDANRDPFWDPIEDIYLGSCHVWLNNVAYCMNSDDYLDITDHHGKAIGKLHARLAPCDKKGKLHTDEAMVFDPKQLEGKSLNFMVMLPQARELDWIKEECTRGIYLSFSFYDHPNIIRTDTVSGSVNPLFDFRKHFSIPQVGPDLLSYLQSHALLVEVWGTQTPEGSEKPPNGLPYRMGRRGSVLNSAARRGSVCADPRAKDLKDALTLKSQEANRLRIERDQARTELSRLSPGSRVSSASSTSSHTLVINDPHPSPRRHSIVPMAGHSSSPTMSLDAEIAKALKVFFRDVKDVQKEIDSLKSHTAEAMQSKKNKNAKPLLEQQQKMVDGVDTTLADCVGALKESMVTIIRRKKQEDQKNGHS